MNGPKIIVELLISPLEAIHIFLPTNEKNEKTISNYLRGRNIRWGIFRGARGGGFGVGRFKRGAELEHNHFGNIRMVPKQQVDRKNKLGVFYGLKNYFLNSSHVFFFFSCFV